MTDRPAKRTLPSLLLFLVSSALAAILRIVYLLPLRGNPLFDDAHKDSVEYVDRAREILAGQFWGQGVYFHSAPLYPYFLALVLGPGSATGLWWVRVVQALLSGVTAGLLALTARRLFGAAAGVATAVLAVLYAPFLFYAGELLEITLTLFFLALMAWVLARETLGWAHLLGAGLCLGAASLGKPNLLILLPVILVWLGFLRTRPAAWPWRRGLVFVAGVLVLVAPITLRNRIVGDDWVLISSNGGINLFIGNNPASSGGFQVPTAMQYDLETSSQRVASEALKRPVKPSEASRFWTGRAWAFFTKRPGQAARLIARKAGLLIGAYEIPNHFNIYFFREYLAPTLRWPLVWYTLVLPFGVLGMIFGLRRNGRSARSLRPSATPARTAACASRPSTAMVSLPCATPTRPSRAPSTYGVISSARSPITCRSCRWPIPWAARFPSRARASIPRSGDAGLHRRTRFSRRIRTPSTACRSTRR